MLLSFPSLIVLSFVSALLGLFFALKESIRDSQQPSRTPRETYGEPEMASFGWSNGGAGPTGVLSVIAAAFLAREKLSERVHVDWYMNISRLGLQILQEGVCDVALTYEREQEDILIKRGKLFRLGTLFNDHFILVGPRRELHAVPSGPGEELEVLKTILTSNHHLFLTRDDKSATNCKELACWHEIGAMKKALDWKRLDFAPAGTLWLEKDVPAHLRRRYLRKRVFPQEALQEADRVEAFTLTDWGSWHSYLAVQKGFSGLTIYAYGGKRLLNECCAVVRPNSRNDPVMQSFERFLKSDALVEAVSSYKRNGVQLFTPPKMQDFPEWDASKHASGYQGLVEGKTVQ